MCVWMDTAILGLFSSLSAFVLSIVMNPCSPSAIMSSFRIFLLSVNRGRLNLVIVIIENSGQITHVEIHHSQEYFLEVIVHVPLDVDVFHLYGWHDHPLPNIIHILLLKLAYIFFSQFNFPQISETSPI